MAVFRRIVFFFLPTVGFQLSNVVGAMIQCKKAGFYPCLLIIGHPAQLCIDTVYDLHFLPCIVQRVHAAIPALVFVPLLHGCLIGVVQERISCQSPFFPVPIQKVNQILHRVRRSKRHPDLSVVVHLLIQDNAFSLVRDAQEGHCNRVRRFLRVGRIDRR